MEHLSDVERVLLCVALMEWVAKNLGDSPRGPGVDEALALLRKISGADKQSLPEALAPGEGSPL